VVVIEARLHLRRLATGELGHRRRAGATSTPRLMSLRRKRKSSRMMPVRAARISWSLGSTVQSQQPFRMSSRRFLSHVSALKVRTW
jgi:hypothetical protein